MLVCAKCNESVKELCNSTQQPQLLICEKCKAQEKDHKTKEGK
ncbi:hypothetical protein [Bacillus thuringiensis]|nr:hypothetical protein [Bacillus thuringiensis]